MLPVLDREAAAEAAAAPVWAESAGAMTERHVMESGVWLHNGLGGTTCTVACKPTGRDGHTRGRACGSGAQVARRHGRSGAASAEPEAGERRSWQLQLEVERSRSVSCVRELRGSLNAGTEF